MACRLRRWITNPGVSGSKSLGESDVKSAFHPSKLDYMSTRSSWGPIGKK